jgi:hypothetical protein
MKLSPNLSVFWFLLAALSGSYLEAAPPDEGRAKDYKAELKNNSMFDSQAESETTQASSFIQAENLNTTCIDTALNGRRDSLCAENPNHPECAGLGSSIDFALTCVEWLDPQKTKCKTYGSNGYTMEEWIAFGTQYQRSISKCDGSRAEAMAINDQSFETDGGVVVGALQSLTVTTESNRGEQAPPAPRLSQSGLTVGKTTENKTSVSGASTNNPGQVATEEKSVAAKSDGSKSLGYEPGEVLRRTLAGESLHTIVTEAPVAGKLKAQHMNQLIAGLNDADAIVAGVQLDENRKLGKNKQEDSPLPEAPKLALSKELSPSSPDVAESASVKAPTTEVLAVAPPAPAALVNPIEASSKSLLRADRIAAIEAYARAKREGRQVASLEEVLRPFDGQKQKEKTDEFGGPQSLFERIRSAYQKYSQKIKALGPSSESRKVQSLERPELFQSMD